MKGPIQSVEVSYLVHATEDPEKIQGSVERLLARKGPLETEKMEGHYGNKIMRATLHLTGEEADRAFGNVVRSLPEKARVQILSELSMHLDEHSALFLRLDKQRLVSGSVSLDSGDPVRIKVKPRSFLMKGGGPSFFRRLLESV